MTGGKGRAYATLEVDIAGDTPQDIFGEPGIPCSFCLLYTLAVKRSCAEITDPKELVDSNHQTLEVYMVHLAVALAEGEHFWMAGIYLYVAARKE